MDAVIFGIVAVVLSIITLYYTEEPLDAVQQSGIEPEDTTRTTKLNESFYEDPNAFTEISSALGFTKP